MQIYIDDPESDVPQQIELWQSALRRSRQYPYEAAVQAQGLQLHCKAQFEVSSMFVS